MTDELSANAPVRTRRSDLSDHHSRILVQEGISWRVWPSVIENLDECRPPKVVTDLGPGRLFFHARNGEFFAMPYPDASWATLK
ncbi:MAG TPA: hypothetical protein VFA43_23420, partial [Gemmatimonadaceae bacterium]|nr:hypothetical protein [Gemmatimonadaceae bacterium]